MNIKRLSVSVIPFTLFGVAANALADGVIEEKEQVIIIKEQPAAQPVPAPAPVAKPAAAPAMPAAVAPGPWYVGGGIGRTWLNGGATAIDPSVTAGNVLGLDDNDTGWKAFAGYQFTRNLAAELSYVDLGDYSVRHNPGPQTDKVGPKAWCASGVGSYPLSGGFSVLGKLGICKWDDHASGNPSDDGTDLTFGVGASYDVTSRVSTRLELDRYRNVAHDKGDVDMLSLNLLYRF